MQFYPWDGIKSASLSLYIVFEIAYNNSNNNDKSACHSKVHESFPNFRSFHSWFKFENTSINSALKNRSVLFPIVSPKFSFINIKKKFEHFQRETFNHIKHIFAQVNFFHNVFKSLFSEKLCEGTPSYAARREANILIWFSWFLIRDNFFLSKIRTSNFFLPIKFLLKYIERNECIIFNFSSLILSYTLINRSK